MNHNIIAVCALTLDTEEAVVDAFYGDLQGAVDSVYQRDVLIAAGAGMQHLVRRTQQYDISWAGLLGAGSALISTGFHIGEPPSGF